MGKINPYAAPETLEFQDRHQESFIRVCETLLGAGKGHAAIIQHLRKKGHSHEEAKQLSYFYFDIAKQRLMRSQIVTRVLANTFIIAGIALPLVQWFWSGRIYLITVAFIIPGIFLKNKIVNPARLPEG
jgi:hypothetical protein